MGLPARWCIILSFAGCASLSGGAARAQLPSGTNWALTFADEFNGASVDSMKWSNGHPWDPSSSDPDNVYVSNGVLNLNAVRTSSASSSSSFTGAGISTENSSYNEFFGMTYGYIEASMKMPSLPGSWPSFWMLGSGWPPEADICEFPAFVNGTFSPYNYSDNIHYVDSSGADASLGNGVHYTTGADLTAGFHNYGMAWTPTSITFYLDGVVQATITDTTALSSNPGDMCGNGPLYMMLDNSGGGSWPGVPSLAQWALGASSDLQVQWVRVWKNTSGSATSISWGNTAANGSGSWTNSAAWSGGQVPQLSSQTAVFGVNSVNNQTVSWNNSQTVGGLSFDSSTSYTIGSAAGSLMLASGSLMTNNVLIDATAASGSGANYLNSRLELWSNATMQTSSKPLIVGGNIIGTGGLTIAAGPVTLASSSSYSGGTTLSGGTLTAAANSALGTGALQFNAGGNNYTATLALSGGIELDNPITLTARSNASMAIDNSSGNNIFGGQLSLQVGGANYIVQSDAGQLTFSGRLAGGPAITVGTGVSGTRTVTFQGAGNTLLSGSLANGNVGTLAVLVGGPGAVVLAASNLYTGGTTIAGGTLQLGNGGSSGSVLLGSVIVDNGTLAFDRSNYVSQGADFSPAAITGTGGVAQLGAGTLNLTGSNTYAGVTAVNQGTLLLNFSAAGAPVSNIINSLSDNSALAMGGGNLSLQGSGAAANSQQFNGLTVNAGGSAIVLASGSGGSMSASVGGIARNAGGTIDFTLPGYPLAGGGGISTSQTTIGPGVLVDQSSNWTAYATVNGGSTWATVSGGNIVGLASYSNSNSFPNSNVGTTLITQSLQESGTVETGVATFNASSTTLALSGTNDLADAGGILVTPAAIGTVVTGGAFHAGGGNGVVLIDYGSLKVTSVILNSTSAATSLTVSGTGTTTLGGANTYSGGTCLDGATSISANNNLGASGGTVTFDGGMLTTTAGITNTHPFVIGASGGTIEVASANQYYLHTANTLLGNGPLTVTGTGALAQNGAGNLRIDVTNPYSGNLTVQSGGIFEYGAAGAVSSSAAFDIGNQGELAVQGNSAVSLPNSITINGSANSVLSFENGTAGSFSGPITLNANATVGLRDWYNNATVRSGAITGQISGSGGLSINSGSGMGGALALGNAANTYAGGTTVTNAVLLIGSPTIGGLGTTAASEAGALGTGSLTINTGGIAQLGYRSQNIAPSAPQTVPNNISLNGGSIYANDNYQHLSGTLNVTAAGGTLGSTYIGDSGYMNKGLFVDGVVTGSGNLTIVQAGAYELNGWGNEQGNGYNAGLVMLNAANSYSGTITVIPYNAGGGNYLAINNSTALQNATVNLSADNTGATQQYGASTLLFQTGLGGATLGALAGSGDVALTGMNEQVGLFGGDAIALTVGGNGANTTYSGDLSGSGSLTKIGGGAMLLSNNSTYAGATNVNGGTLRLGVNQALPSGTAVTLNGGEFDLNGHSVSVSQFIVNNSAMSQSNGSLTVTTNADGAVQLAGAVSSTGSYTISGGSLTVTASPMDVGWYGSGTFNQTGGLVTTDNFLIVGRQTGSTGVYAISGGTAMNTGSFLGVGQQGSGTLNVSGSGVVVAAGAGLSIGGLYGGGGNGTVNLSSGGRIQTTAVTTGGGISTFNFNGGTLQAAAGASSSFFPPLTQVITGVGGATIDSNGNNISIASPLIGNGGLAKIGAGTLVVQSINSYSGSTVISGGVLQLGLMNAGPTGFGALPSTTALSITNSGAALDVDGAQQTVASLSGVAGANVYLGGGTLAVAGSTSTTFAGNISDSGGSSSSTDGSLTLTGNGRLVLTGTDSYSGGTFVEGDATLIVTNLTAIETGTSLYVGGAISAFAPIVPQSELGAVPANADAAVAPVPEPGAMTLLVMSVISTMLALHRRKEV